MTQIALIAGTYQPQACGVAHYTCHLRQNLDLHNVESLVLTTHAAAQIASESNVLGVVNDWGLTQLSFLVGAIHATQADLLHIQHAAGTYGFDRAIFLLPLLLKLTGWRSPIVTTIHEYGWWEWQPALIPSAMLEPIKLWGQNRGWWDREDGFLLTGSDAIITTNDQANQVIYSRLPRLNAPVYEVPIGANISVAAIDRASARQSVRQQCGWSTDSLIIAFFGFLHPVKGLETLLPAFKQVLKEHPNAKLLLIGGVESLALPAEHATQYWDKLEATIAHLNLENAVHMTGYLDETTTSHYLTGCDVGVLPFNHGVTRKSGSLLALMAHSLPIVATRATPPDPELNDDLGQFITPRRVDELAIGLNRLLKDADLREQFGSAGHAFSQRFNWSAIARTHLDIYQKVLYTVS